ncbi:MAG: hypothetical protein JSV49_00385 [Thermoplasmata archaeon]|nr:MAG: hypothetical protein JSV49_00385 [Thermoplasmata archaeon]
MTAEQKYGVVVCPKCHYPRGIKLGTKKSSCYHCSYNFTVKNLKIFYMTESEAELSEAVGRLNAKLRGGLEEYLEFLEEYENVPVGYEQLEPHKRIAAKLMHIPEPKKRLERLAFELSVELNEFEEADMVKVLDELGIRGKRAENFMKSLVENNIIYEPRPGKYRIVDSEKNMD